MSDESAREAASGERNIRIHLSERATLKAVRVDGGFHILVGDDVEIRGVTPDHMRSLVGSVMDAYVPSEIASRILTGWSRRGRRRDDADAGADVAGPEQPPSQPDQRAC